MTNSAIRLAVLSGVLAACMAMPALARNTVVENALSDRPELSAFYQGLVSTGVINELQEGRSYTIFAPTNEAFSRLPIAEYPCFYSQECRPQVAQVLRNHIVPGEKHLTDMNKGRRDQGAILSLFAIDNHHIIASEPFRGKFTVNGQRVLSENQLLGSVLYRVDGVLAGPKEMAEFAAPRVVVVQANTGLPPRSPDGTVVTITHHYPAR